MYGGLEWLASLNPFKSASTIQEDQVEQTIEEDPEPDPIMQGDTPNTKEMSNLMKAVGKGEKEKVLDIIEKTPDILNWTFEKPPLIEAISQMNYEMVELLISKKPGLASIMSGDDTPLTYMMKPKFNKKPERMKIFREVLKHAAVNQRIGDSKETALHLSIRRRDSEAFATLVNAKDIDFNVQNKEDETPLHLATHFNQRDYVHALAYSLNCGGRHKIKFELTDKNNTRADQYGQESGNWLKKIIAAKDDPEKLKELDEEYRNSKDAKVIEVNLTQIFYNSENIRITNYQGKLPEQRYLNSENQEHQYQRRPNQSMQKHNQLNHRPDYHNQTQSQHIQRQEHYNQTQSQHIRKQDHYNQTQSQHIQRQDHYNQTQSQHIQRQDHYNQPHNQHFSTQDQSFQRQNNQINQGQIKMSHGRTYSNNHWSPNRAPNYRYPQPTPEASGYSQAGRYQKAIGYPQGGGYPQASGHSQANGYSPTSPQHPEQINREPTYNGSSQYNAQTQEKVHSPPPAYSASASSYSFQEYQNTRPEKYYQPRETEIPPNQLYIEPIQYQVPRPRETVIHQITRQRESVSPHGGILQQKHPAETDSYPPHSESYETNTNIYSANTNTYPHSLDTCSPNPINYQSTNNYYPSAYNQTSPDTSFPTQPVNHPGEQQKVPQETSYNPEKNHLLLTPDCAHDKRTGLDGIRPCVPYPGCGPTVPNVHRSPTTDLNNQRRNTTSPNTDRTTFEPVSTFAQPEPVAELYGKGVQSLNKNWIHRELLVKRNSNNRYKMYYYMDQFKTKPNMNRQITV